MMAARDSYKRFVESVVDAVDSGALNSGARQALADAQARLPQLDGLAVEQGTAALRERLGKLNGAIGTNAAIAVLLPLRRAINETDMGISKLAMVAEAREREVIAARFAICNSNRRPPSPLGNPHQSWLSALYPSTSPDSSGNGSKS